MAEFRSNWNTEDDFHARLYQQLDSNLSSGVTRDAWDYLVEALTDWRAYRPVSVDQIRQSGIPVLPLLQQKRSQLISSASSGTVSMETAAWEDVAPLFWEAQAIKPTKGGSPMFPSKLCHFLVPHVFPVCDHEFAGTSAQSYEEFWRDARDAWCECPNRDELIAELRSAIPHEVGDEYPWCTKIVDLCAAGANA